MEVQYWEKNAPSSNITQFSHSLTVPLALSCIPLFSLFKYPIVEIFKDNVV